MEFCATTDRATPINLCNHAYWNLSGDGKRDVKGHELTLHCPLYLPVDGTQIPTGEVASVSGTVFDFKTATTIGSRLLTVDGGGEPGYDHCFVAEGVAPALTGGSAAGATAAGAGAGAGASAGVASVASITARADPVVIAVLRDPVSGRKMTVSTTQPGVQVYTGNWLPKTAGEGARIRQHAAVCLETQNFPDAPNKPGFPTAILEPGQVYRQVTVHAFEW